MGVAGEGLEEFAGGGVEDFHEFVRAARGEHFAIGREGEAEDGVAVRRGDFADESAIRGAPDLHFPATRRDAAAGGQPLAIAAEIEGEDAVGERGLLVAGADGAAEGPGGAAAPDDGAIFLGTGEEASVGGVGEGADGAERTAERVEAGAIGGAPGVDDLVFAGGGHGEAIRGEGHGVHGFFAIGDGLFGFVDFVLGFFQGVGGFVGGGFGVS